jgi:hypothetical protein
MMYPSFETALQKGDIGERIVKQFLESKGYIVYRPETKNKAHYFDILATKGKEQVVAIDVKTKARLNKWPAQGINKRNYDEYMAFVSRVNVPFFLFFVDDKTGDVHYQDIRKLKDHFMVNEKIIGWDLSQMIYLFNIGQELIAELSKYDQRGYKFEPKK